MKKLTLLLLLLALVLPGCAAPAASQPGATQPQTVGTQEKPQSQTLPQTLPPATQTQDKDAWEWMKELAPNYNFNRKPNQTSTMWSKPEPIGRELEEILIWETGTPVEAKRTESGLVLSFLPVSKDQPGLVLHFSQNEEGKMVVTKTENLFFQKTDLTREDFEGFQLNKTTFWEVLQAVGIWYDHRELGTPYIYHLADGGTAHLYYKLSEYELGPGIVERIEFYPPASQSSTNEK